MPYVSKKQERFFNANKKKLEKQGVSVDEWNKSSRGLKLPEKKAPLREADFRLSQKSKRGKNG